MNGIDFLAYTNAIIYLFLCKPYMLPYGDAWFGVSVITEMELLSFPRITSEELNNLHSLLFDWTIFLLNSRFPMLSSFFQSARRAFLYAQGRKVDDSQSFFPLSQVRRFFQHLLRPSP